MFLLKMIRTFRHKGLEEFFHSGSKQGIAPHHAAKLARLLDRLDASTSPQDMNLPGFDFHPLRGDREGEWSVSVNGNWRVVFGFQAEGAIDVDYLDYH